MIETVQPDDKEISDQNNQDLGSEGESDIVSFRVPVSGRVFE